MRRLYKKLALYTTVAILTGCGNYLPAKITAQVVGEQVAGGIFGKTVFDPIWEFFFGKPNESELQEFKKSFSAEATRSIIEAIIPSAHAGEIKYRCKQDEPQEDCRNRVASEANYQFNIYAGKFFAAFIACRDSIALSPETGAKDYTEQVELITTCIADKGFSREIQIILNHIQRR